MRLKIASAVEGCLYSLLKTVPGRPSKYSNERREETDMLSKTFIALFERLSVFIQSFEIHRGSFTARN